MQKGILKEAERHFSIDDKEMLVAMHALAKFRQYLVCRRFVPRVDHNSLRSFLSQRDLNNRQQKWVSKL